MQYKEKKSKGVYSWYLSSLKRELKYTLQVELRHLERGVWGGEFACRACLLWLRVNIVQGLPKGATNYYYAPYQKWNSLVYANCMAIDYRKSLTHHQTIFTFIHYIFGIS